MADKPIVRVPAGSSRQDAFVDTMIGAMNPTIGFGSGANPLSGLQDPRRDRTVFNRSESFAPGLWSDQQNVDLYMTSGLAARIVDLVADDSTSSGITIEGDEPGGVLSELNRLRWAERCADAIRWSRLHGGAAIILISDDAPDLAQPLRPNNIGKINDLRVVDVTFLSVYGWYLDDPKAENFGMPQFYMVQTKGMATPYTVHESRTITFGGQPVPGYIARTLNVPWRGRSIYQGCRTSLLRYASGLAWTERMLERKQQLIWRMNGMADLLLQTYDPVSQTSLGKSVIADRVQGFDMVRGIMNTAVTDGLDSIEVKDLSLGGVPELFQTYQMDISADCGIPLTALFGRSPSGHNATGQSDSENYHSLVENTQHNDLEPALLRLIPLILLQKTYAFEQPQEWTLVFNPLWTPDDAAQAKAKVDEGQAKLFEAQAAQVYVTIQALAPDDVARFLADQNLFGMTPELLLQREPIEVQAAEAEEVNDDPDE